MNDEERQRLQDRITELENSAEEQRQRTSDYTKKLAKKASDRGVAIIYLVILIVIVGTALW
jgi:hypothetical protein